MDEEIKKHTILILTQTVFSGNYGAILQAFALQHILRDMGHVVRTDASNDSKGITQFVLFGKNQTKRLLNVLLRRRYELSPLAKDKLRITKRVRTFIGNNIDIVHIDNYEKQTRNYTAFVVGSDQVWRKSYANVTRNLLDFATGREAKRLSYAASFGKDTLAEYDTHLIDRTAQLAELFDGISVREDSGVGICKQQWGLDATQHIDPTLLVDNSIYEDIVAGYNDSANYGNDILFTYILDPSDVKQNITTRIAKKKHLKVQGAISKKYTGHAALVRDEASYVLPPVEHWLQGFRDAKFIVTDSFHGCVFSIIFNKPFVAIGNKERGLTRFTSLLHLFGLEDRLVSSVDEVTGELIEAQINWEQVNSIRTYEQNRSLQYLRKCLGEVR